MSTDINRTLGRIEANTELLVKRSDEHEERINKLAANQSRMFGYGAGALAVWGFIVSFVKLGG